MPKRSKPIVSSPTKPPSPSDIRSVDDLAALQRTMAACVMRPLTEDDRMRGETETGESVEALASAFIKPNDRLGSFDRLEIYNRQYWFRVLDCLFDDYPGLRAVLGDRRFQELARAYLASHPSRSFTLRNLGSELVNFLRAQPQWARPYEQLALDMARLEWAQVVAFDGEARKGIKLEQLAGRAPAEIRLRLQPYLSLLELSYPVDTMVVRLLREDEGLRGEASNAMEEMPGRPARRRQAGRIRPERVWLAVHRADSFVYFKRMEETPFRVLQAIAGGADLESACALAAEAGLEKLQGWFETWASLGWFWMKS